MIFGAGLVIHSLGPPFATLLREPKMQTFLKAFVRDERGVSAMEYAVLAGIVVIALGAMAVGFNTNIGAMFTNLFTQVTTSQNKA
jgi:pilus assembly protein Flp/PilA